MTPPTAEIVNVHDLGDKVPAALLAGIATLAGLALGLLAVIDR